MQKVDFAVVFPGQGSQREGMGLDFYDNFTIARAIYEEAQDALGENLTQICFTEDNRLHLTEFTQPAILTTEIAMFQVCREIYSLEPKYFAGHSLGEYSALTAAGVFSLPDAVQIVRKRGALMQKASSNASSKGIGSMSALIYNDIEETDFRNIVIKAGAEIANLNSKDQVVISGKRESVIQAGEDLLKAYPTMDVIPLTVSVPFHSSLMKDVEVQFKEYLEGFTIDPEKAKSVLSNYTGNFHEPDLLIQNLVHQISGTVNWIKNMEVISSTHTKIIEIGPNRVLGKFFSTLGVETQSIFNARSMQKTFNISNVV